MGPCGLGQGVLWPRVPSELTCLVVEHGQNALIRAILHSEALARTPRTAWIEGFERSRMHGACLAGPEDRGWGRSVRGRIGGSCVGKMFEVPADGTGRN